MKDLVTVLVYAWDTYSPAWPVFCYGLYKYWPDCPYKVVFLTNHLEPPCGTAIKVGDENDFFRKMTIALQNIETPYLLFMHEDYWLKKTVKSKAIEQYVGLLVQDKADYIRLIPAPGPDRDFIGDSRLGIINEKSEYRLSFMASLWRVSILREIIKPHLSLWDMEKYGPSLSRRYGDRFLCVKRAEDGLVYDLTAISARQWTQVAYQYARDENICIEFEKLPLPPFRYRIGVTLHSFAYRIKKGILRRLRRLKGKAKKLSMAKQL